MQNRLFDLSHPDMPPAQRHSTTSVAAAELIRPHVAGKALLVLEYFRDRGDAGATDEACHLATGLKMNSQRPRRIDLLHAGYVCDSGRTAIISTGNKATVWMITTKGREALNTKE